MFDHIGQSPSLAKVLRTAEIMPSYVCYIPQRLGQNPVLDTAVDLVFSTAGLLAAYAQPVSRFDLARKYVTALGYLREAIADPIASLSSEVLAACTLLSTYECLNSTSLAAWINHHRGIYRLIKRRGPGRFRSDFERQLLLASAGTVFTIALRDNHPCYLDQPAWQDALAYKPSDSIIASEWVDSYRCQPLLCRIPRLLFSCRDIVRNRASQTVDKIESLVASASLLRTAFLDMAEKHGWKSGRYAQVLAPRGPDQALRVFCDAEDQRAANYANYLSGLAIIDRIIFALRPSSSALEQECRLSALDIQYLHSFLKTEPRLSGLYLIHSERVALAVVLTSTYWAERGTENGCAFDPNLDGRGNIIERWKFDRFDDILSARAIDAPLMYHYPQHDEKEQFLEDSEMNET